MKLSLGLSPRDYSVAGGAVAYDTDAQAYFTANTAITSSADKNAINTFYLGLKSDGIYTKIKAMYLPIWGSAASSKWNLINNRSFDLSFSVGGMTFTSSGMTSNGTSGYADTYLIPSTHLTTANSFHFSFYSQTQVTESKYEMGAITTVQQTLALNENTTTKKSIIHGSYPTNWASTTSTNTKGFQIGTRLLSNDLRLHFNGSKIATNTSNWAGTFVGIKVFLCAINYSPNYASTKTCSFSSIGDALTDTEANNFYNRVQTLMTYFGINV